MVGQNIGYVRVSTFEQNPARQVAAIGEVEETFTDYVSGASRAERTVLATVLRHAGRGDIVRVAPMDRLARSVVDLAQIVIELTGREVTVEFVAERSSFDPGARTLSLSSSCTCSAPWHNWSVLHVSARVPGQLLQAGSDALTV